MHGMFIYLPIFASPPPFPLLLPSKLILLCITLLETHPESKDRLQAFDTIPVATTSVNH